jgi:hypothetical protein
MAGLSANHKYVTMAKQALAQSLGVDVAAIRFGTSRQERIPDPPLRPGEMKAAVIRYRYFILLEYGDEVYQYRAEDGKVSFLGQS